MDHSTPHGTPKSDPWGMTQATEWKSEGVDRGYGDKGGGIGDGGGGIGGGGGGKRG